ncbi:hypothetical protein MCERHM32_01535 [Methylophilaceae bacterium]
MSTEIGEVQPLAKQLANDMNVVLNDIDLHSVIAACNGSVRNVAYNVARFARRKSI